MTAYAQTKNSYHEGCNVIVGRFVAIDHANVSRTTGTGKRVVKPDCSPVVGGINGHHQIGPARSISADAKTRVKPVNGGVGCVHRYARGGKVRLAEMYGELLCGEIDR